jgi:hypothetical protein
MRLPLYAAFFCLAVLGTDGFAQSGASTPEPSSAATAQSAPPAGANGPQPGNKLAQLDQSAISGNTYTNLVLGFSHDFPASWHVYDLAAQRREIETNHASNYGDAPEAEREHEETWRCTHVLLWTSKYTEQEHKEKEESVPLFVVTAWDPGCFTGVTFPTSMEDRDAIQKIFDMRLNELGQDAKTTTFVLQGHLMLAFSAIADTGDSKLYISLLMTQVKNYWVGWMFSCDSDAGLQDIRKTMLSSMKFNTP